MSLNNPHQINDSGSHVPLSPKLGVDFVRKTSEASTYHSHQLASASTANPTTVIDSSRQFANSLRMLVNEESIPSVTTPSSRFLMPSTPSSVKEEPNIDASQFEVTNSEGHSTQEMSIPVDKVYPLVISEYYTNPVIFSQQDNKEKVTAHCRRCGRPVTGWWAPRLVTSNFITHLKSCSMELYQHFQDTKRRCGWAARRYTVKLHAKDSSIHSHGWKFNPSQSTVPMPVQPPTESLLMNDGTERVLMPVTDEMTPSCSKTNIYLLRSLLTFAAQEVRPLASLCTGSVHQLLTSLNESVEFPSEAEIRKFLGRHQLSIETLAFAQLPLLEQSVVVLSLHGQLKDASFGSQSNCLIALWNCFINNGALQKCLFSIRRYPDAQTAIFHALAHLEECRERQKRSLRVQPSPVSSNIVVLSIDPSHYLQLPLTTGMTSRFSVDLNSLQSRLNLSKSRLLDDFCYRLWRIFIDSVESIRFLPRLLTSVLKFASREAVSNSDWSQNITVFHLKQLTSAFETLINPYSPSASVEIRRQFTEYRALLETVLDAGQYFESAIQRLHRSGVNAGSRLPLLLGLQKKIVAERTISSVGNNNYVEDLRRTLISGLEKTFAEEVSDSSMGETSFSLLATFADPQYKLFWVEDPEQEAIYRDRIVKHLTARQPKVDESAAPSSASTSSSPSSTAEIVNESGDGLLDFVAKRRRLAISSAGCDWPIMDEVQTYLGNHEEAGPLDFWANVRHQENYPNVYKLHLEIHSVPASCLDVSLQLGLTHEMLTGVATSSEWQRETDEVAQCLILAKCIGYEFNS